MLDQKSVLQILLQLRGGEGHRIKTRQSPAALGGVLQISNNTKLSQKASLEVAPPDSLEDKVRLRSGQGQVSFEDKVRTAMLQVLSENPELGAAFEHFIGNPPVIETESLSKLSEPEPDVSVPRVVIKELEAAPGCRSFSTTTCTKHPVGKT